MIQQIASVLQQASWTVENHNWFTTYEYDYLSRPYLSVQAQLLWFSTIQLLVARLLQSAVPWGNMLLVILIQLCGWGNPLISGYTNHLIKKIKWTSPKQQMSAGWGTPSWGGRWDHTIHALQMLLGSLHFRWTSDKYENWHGGSNSVSEIKNVHFLLFNVCPITDIVLHVSRFPMFLP